jgi:hypothetical protein
MWDVKKLSEYANSVNNGESAVSDQIEESSDILVDSDFDL